MKNGNTVSNKSSSTCSGNGLNMLPYNGEAVYFGKVYNDKTSQSIYDDLLHGLAWEHDHVYMFGKHIYTKRKIAWYGDKGYSYTYSNVKKTALQWTPLLRDIKEQTQHILNESFNSCLANLYHSGNEGMAWHSDGEKMLKPNGAIASLTFGAERKFSFKHKKTGVIKSIVLEHGSLLVMKGEIQKHWLHRLPPTKSINKPRINLTFRTILL